MSENITHTAVTDDCARLALHSPEICEAFKLALSERLEIARLGGVTRSGGKFVVPLLERMRQEWSTHQGEDGLLDKLAYVLGWLCHRAADLQMKPVFREADPACALDPTDCSIYHDVYLFREVYGSGGEEPYVPETLEAGMASSAAARALGVDQSEDVLRALWQRALIALHTFIPDQEDIDGWLERLFKLRQRFYVDLRRYAEAFADPDPDKVRRFIVDTRFYDPNDGLIRLARSIQRGKPDQTIDLEAAVRDAVSQSQYAQALRRGYLYLQAASGFFEGRIDREALMDALERGKQGVSWREEEVPNA